MSDTRMIPISQTKFHTATMHGNCFRAAIASLLEIGIDEMPAFEDHGADSHEPFMAWCWSCDLIPLYLPATEPPAGYSIINGQSPRGIGHSCVALDGLLVWDPHPSRAGLISVDGYLVFEPG